MLDGLVSDFEKTLKIVRLRLSWTDASCKVVAAAPRS